MVSETDLIRRYFTSAPRRADVVLGVGDDGAVVRPPADAEVVVSVDTLIQDVHFPHETPAAAVGYKALAVNLSDLAAMGAEPAWATLALTLPEADESWLADFSAGFFRLANRHRLALIGGDLTRGPMSVTVQVMGLLPRGEALRRDGARPGDLIFVTGSIGDAGLGLAAMRGTRTLDTISRDWCLQRLNEPSPRIGAGLGLRRIAHATIDVSDGLAIDLARVLTASGVGACISLDAIPLSAAARAVYGDAVDWAAVLTAGDDYELLFTVSPARAQDLARAFVGADCGITRIGQVERRAGLRYTLHGAAWTLDVRAGYDHFAGTPA
ncbi:MAG: thiamine-phosphate kinase [Gammaproteobacteria bacterium]